VPFQNFATADGWIVVACPKEKFWVALCGALGRPELATDERFADFAARDRNRDELLPILDGLFAERTSSEWLDALAAAGVPNARVNDVEAALEEPQALARGAVVEVEHPTLGTVRQVGSPLRLGDAAPLRRGPFRGEHTEEVLAEVCGYSRERIDELAAAGVFGS
jgi:crotonobetainyl-CoA:carnitine CoA-transferase CaiB-like acyl-CoA transferase